MKQFWKDMLNKVSQAESPNPQAGDWQKMQAMMQGHPQLASKGGNKVFWIWLGSGLAVLGIAAIVFWPNSNASPLPSEEINTVSSTESGLENTEEFRPSSAETNGVTATDQFAAEEESESSKNAEGELTEDIGESQLQNPEGSQSQVPLKIQGAASSKSNSSQIASSNSTKPFNQQAPQFGEPKGKSGLESSLSGKSSSKSSATVPVPFHSDPLSAPNSPAFGEFQPTAKGIVLPTLSSVQAPIMEESRLPKEQNSKRPLHLRSLQLSGGLSNNFSPDIWGWGYGVDVDLEWGHSTFNLGVRQQQLRIWNTSMVNESYLLNDTSFRDIQVDSTFWRADSVWVITGPGTGTFLPLDSVQDTLRFSRRALLIDSTRISTRFEERRLVELSYTELPILWMRQLHRGRWAYGFGGGFVLSQLVQAPLEGNSNAVYTYGADLSARVELRYFLQSDFFLLGRLNNRIALDRLREEQPLWHYKLQFGVGYRF